MWMSWRRVLTVPLRCRQPSMRLRARGARASSLSLLGVTPSREPSISGRACGSLGMAPRDRFSCCRHNTPGFQKGMGVMVMFTGLTPHEHPRAGDRIAFPPPGSVPPNDNVADANPNTFYSAMSNIDFEIGDGNPAAVAVRFHVAQHSFLTHMNFRLGSASGWGLPGGQ